MERKGIVKHNGMFWSTKVGWTRKRSLAAVMTETLAKHFIWQFTPAGLRANHGETIAKTFTQTTLPVFVPNKETPMRYGMRFTTIRYWQKMAHDLNLYNGIHFTGCLKAANLDELGAKQIGHDAIAAAFVRTPDAMRALLDGTK